MNTLLKQGHDDGTLFIKKLLLIPIIINNNDDTTKDNIIMLQMIPLQLATLLQII